VCRGTNDPDYLKRRRSDRDGFRPDTIAFNIKAFHDTILGGGALPLTILEKRVEGWIEASR
jgi:hypothetical protein